MTPTVSRRPAVPAGEPRFDLAGAGGCAGEVAGCAAVVGEGTFPLMLLYGADEDGRTPGFRAGEAIAWQVDGREAAGPALMWADDKTAHGVTLEEEG